jgi:hypothetical protein
MPRDVALARLATRYFASHGPATLHDFAWWSGLLLADARAGIDAAGAELDKETLAGRSWWSAAGPATRSRLGAVAALLPPWDEYIVAYKDRAAALGHLDQEQARVRYAVGNSLLLVEGRVCGAWRRTLTTLTVRVAVDFWAPVTHTQRRAVREAASRYARFLGKRLDMTV